MQMERDVLELLIFVILQPIQSVNHIRVVVQHVIVPRIMEHGAGGAHQILIDVAEIQMVAMPMAMVVRSGIIIALVVPVHILIVIEILIRLVAIPVVLMTYVIKQALISIIIVMEVVV